MVRQFIKAMAVSLVSCLALSACVMPGEVDEAVQQAQQTHFSPRNGNMETICKSQAAHRFTTTMRYVTVSDMKAYQGSYELRGETRDNDKFTCTFDDSGRFLHVLTT